MNTPIYDFLKSYNESKFLRLHMPGHKGKKLFSNNFLNAVYPFDITEIKGADSLFEAEGIIAESERNTSKLFGTDKTLFSTGGSTLCIQTMLSLVYKKGSTVIAARNSHKAFINACALLDLDVCWVYPDYNGSILSGEISPHLIEKAIIEAKNPSCVYITSPDYLGRTSDIKEISIICKKHGIPLLVDNAHGAHLAFLSESQHPIHLGADMCCDSAHKMLPALTGCAYLHISNKKYSPFAKDTMSIFSSTSPSYLLMASLDLCNKYLEENIKEDLTISIKLIDSLKAKLNKIYTIENSEPLRITINTLKCGLTGTELSEILRYNKIECEYADYSQIVLLFSPLATEEECNFIYSVLSNIKMPRIILPEINCYLATPIIKMSIKDAMLSHNEEIPTEEALNRICGKTKITCPPGVPIVVSGELITTDIINILKKYSINKINVIK